MRALSMHPNIGGVVDHSGDVAGIKRLGEVAVLWGTERSLWNALRSGASGAVIAFANAAPYAAIALWEARRTREEEAGGDWQSRIAPPAELVGALFGSTVRGEDRPDSDIDLLAAFDETRQISLVDAVGIENRLADLLGRPVELVEEGTLKPRVKQSVDAEAVRAF